MPVLNTPANVLPPLPWMFDTGGIGGAVPGLNAHANALPPLPWRVDAGGLVGAVPGLNAPANVLPPLPWRVDTGGIVMSVYKIMRFFQEDLAETEPEPDPEPGGLWARAAIMEYASHTIRATVNKATITRTA